MGGQTYIYEFIRCKGFEARYVERHLARLNALCYALFLTPSGIDIEELRGSIAMALRGGGYSPNHSNVVVVRRYVDGGFEVVPQESLYDDFSLRALRPQGYLRNHSGELVESNTSAKEALLAFERSTAEIVDRGVAIWCRDDGEVSSIDGASVVAVFENDIRFSRLGEGVEFDIAFEVANRERRSVSQGAIMAEELPMAKELFAIDHRGITSLSVLNTKVYMDIFAEKLARQVADLER